jgi:hypothetical protein
MKFEEIDKDINDLWFTSPQAFDAYKRPVAVKFTVAEEPGTVETLEGPVKYDAGFYIMTGPKGEQYPIPPERFATLYTDNKDGTANPKKIVKRARLADRDGTVDTSWGEKLHYANGEDYIVKHGPNDYGVVKKDIFMQTYARS